MGAGLLGVQAQLAQVQLAQLAPIAARALAHGKSDQQVQALLGGPATTMTKDQRNGLLCVSLSRPHNLGWLGITKIQQTACAAEQGL
jgi:hypothetical protein